ncbi:MAG: DUF4149 domain-containing protein [Acidobacteriia bacterium]|nr:DUF4149 domain-containing protein [Terriglobia bacterium]
MSVLRFFMLLSMAIWVGGIIFFSFVVAPALFSILPTRHLSGLVVTRTLGSLHWMGVVCGGVFLICSTFEAYRTSGSVKASVAPDLLVFGMVVITLISQIGVSPKMAALRAEMGEIDKIPAADPRRVAFNHLHQWSTSLEVIVLLLGLTTLYVIARTWAIPVMNAVHAHSLSSRP